MSKVYIRSFINQIARCPLCAGQAGNPLCQHCQAALDACVRTLEQPLCRCGLPLPGASGLPAAALCGACLQQPPPWQWLRPVAAYQPPLSGLVNRFKHHHCRQAEGILRQLLRQHPLSGVPPHTLVVPVPLHWRRQWQRGFNQAARLAQVLADEHALALACLLRRQSGPAQQGASGARRRRARTLFSCDAPLAGQPILLVDDVVTTGQTARLASEALLRAGAGAVMVTCLARTLPPR